MSAAFLVKYKNPTGSECPPAVVTFDTVDGENIGELAPLIYQRLLKPRAHHWSHLKITSIEYLGPWFYEQK